MSRPTRHRGVARPCPVVLCGGIAKRGHLMCRACWSSVPRKLQAEVSRSWRAYRTKLAAAATPEARLSARKHYLDTTQAAIDAAEASRP